MKHLIQNNTKTLLFCLGCLSALAMAPVYAWPLMMIGYCVLVYVLTRTPCWRQSAALIFLFFFGYFLTSLYWVSSSLFIDIDKWWWALPFSFAGLPFILSLFPTIFIGAALFLTQRIEVLKGLKAVLIVTALILADTARGHLFTGFPWNLPAHTWAHTDVMMAALPHIGFWGLNGLTIILFCLPIIFKSRIIITLYLIAITTITLISIPSTQSHRNHNISLIQANIPQDEKWNPQFIQRNFDRYINMSRQAIERDKPDIIIWPETAISQNMLYNSEVNNGLQNLLATLPKNGLLITGYLNFDDDTPLNSIVIFNRNGDMIAKYDKHHLVPFGEYMPFGLETITGFYNFGAGDGVTDMILEEQKLALLPAICYESIFTQYFNNTNEGSVILNLTNDAWFGDTAGPYQHFDHIKFRAAESQFTAIRLSGNGISGFIDDQGRPYALTLLNDASILSNK